jgi:nucleoid DNA-binding protein
MAKKAAKKSGGGSMVATKASKPASTPKPAKISAASNPRSKGEIYRIIAEHGGLARKQVVQVFDTLGRIVAADLGKGVDVNVGGLMKVRAIRKPATPARKGINPFTKEEVMFKAKPARTVVKVRPLKALKDMV